MQHSVSPSYVVDSSFANIRCRRSPLGIPDIIKPPDLHHEHLQSLVTRVSHSNGLNPDMVAILCASEPLHVRFSAGWYLDETIDLGDPS